MNLFEYVGGRIRDLRGSYGEGQGISQEALAKEIGVAANTISRWETATYKPNLEDLEKLARFFNLSILQFFPPENTKTDEPVTALLRAARQLPAEDIEELRRYAEWRRARNILEHQSKATKGRKPAE